MYPIPSIILPLQLPLAGIATAKFGPRTLRCQYVATAAAAGRWCRCQVAKLSSDIETYMPSSSMGGYSRWYQMFLFQPRESLRSWVFFHLFLLVDILWHSLPFCCYLPSKFWNKKRPSIPPKVAKTSWSSRRFDWTDGGLQLCREGNCCFYRWYRPQKSKHLKKHVWSLKVQIFETSFCCHILIGIFFWHIVRRSRRRRRSRHNIRKQRDFFPQLLVLQVDEAEIVSINSWLYLFCGPEEMWQAGIKIGDIRHFDSGFVGS